MSPVAAVSPLSLSLPLTHYSVSICPWCPHSPPSPALSLSGTADGDYGPVLPFVLGPQRDPWLFWTAHSSAPHISYKMQAPFFSLKKEAVECTYSEYVYWNERDYRGLKHVERTAWQKIVYHDLELSELRVSFMHDNISYFSSSGLLCMVSYSL